jgi:hypothetical protein
MGHQIHQILAHQTPFVVVGYNLDKPLSAVFAGLESLTQPDVPHMKEVLSTQIVMLRSYPNFSGSSSEL